MLLFIGNRYSGQRERVMGHLVAFRVLNSFIFNVVGFKALAMKVGASFFFLLQKSNSFVKKYVWLFTITYFCFFRIVSNMGAGLIT